MKTGGKPEQGICMNHTLLEIGNETHRGLKVLSNSGYSCGLVLTILWPRPLILNDRESQALVMTRNTS